MDRGYDIVHASHIDPEFLHRKLLLCLVVHIQYGFLADPEFVPLDEVVGIFVEFFLCQILLFLSS